MDNGSQDHSKKQSQQPAHNTGNGQNDLFSDSNPKIPGLQTHFFPSVFTDENEPCQPGSQRTHNHDKTGRLWEKDHEGMNGPVSGL